MKSILLSKAVGLAVFSGWAAIQAQGTWQPAEGPLKTRWADEVSPDNPRPEYPRPQMVRKEWLSLNGQWDYALTPVDSAKPDSYSARILVPFPVESALSGVMKTVTEKDRIWYRRAFEVPARWAGQRVLLHFGSVDFEAAVSVNGRSVGQHRGGYDAFTFDITDAIKREGTNELVVSVWDPTDAMPFARGKQVRKPNQGIFYTACSGIWQTVWLEPVPEAHIRGVKLTPDVDGGALRLTAEIQGGGAYDLEATVFSPGKEIGTARGPAGSELRVTIPKAHRWTPEDPYLYSLKVTLLAGSQTVDSVASYFGMRKVALAKDDKGVTRIFLNNQPYFMLGPLDQGFWPDGIYTAPTDAALRSDIETTKRLGFNMARKHVKVEPDRWYFWADRLGLLVWQDMPSGDRFIGAKDADIERTPASAQQFESELKAMIEQHYNHPAIVMWVVFNEGWGQYDTPRLVKWVKELDPSRLVNNASGWSDRGVGDVVDMHNYPGPGSPKPEENRAAVLGEFGGLGLKVEGHTWAGKTWGYRGMSSRERLTSQYVKLLRGVWGLKDSPGLSAAVYTQTTDVEYEGNGLMTYDRAVIKMNMSTVAAANRGEIPPLPIVSNVVATAQAGPVQWRYTTEAPAEDWYKEEFNASAWKEGTAGFGSEGTPGAVVRTEWKTSDIWLRREFTLPESVPAELQLVLHHDDDAEVYLDGVLAAKATGNLTDYDYFDLRREARAALKSGRNVMAIHCHQNGGGQYIDGGIVAVIPAR